MGIFRSEPMSKGTLVLPSEGARDFLEIIALHALVQFVDMNAQTMHRRYKRYVQRLEEMERILRFLYAQIEQHAAAAREAVLGSSCGGEGSGRFASFSWSGDDESSEFSASEDDEERAAGAGNEEEEGNSVALQFLSSSSHRHHQQQPLQQQLLPRLRLWGGGGSSRSGRHGSDGGPGEGSSREGGSSGSSSAETGGSSAAAAAARIFSPLRKKPAAAAGPRGKRGGAGGGEQQQQQSFHALLDGKAATAGGGREGDRSSSSRSSSRSSVCSSSRSTRLRRSAAAADPTIRSSNWAGGRTRGAGDDAAEESEGFRGRMQQQHATAAAGRSYGEPRGAFYLPPSRPPVFQLDRVEEALVKLYSQFIRFSQNNDDLIRQRDAAVEECSLLLLAMQQLQPASPAAAADDGAAYDSSDAAAAASGHFGSKAPLRGGAVSSDGSSLLAAAADGVGWSSMGGRRRRAFPQRPPAAEDAFGECVAVEIRSMAFSSVAGVLRSADQEKFARALFRATRGNAYTYLQSADSGQLPLAHASTLEGKSLFVTYYQGGRSPSSAAYEKVMRLCAAFGVHCYNWPSTYEEACRRLADLEVQLADKAHALRGYEQYFLSEIAVLLEPVNAEDDLETEADDQDDDNHQQQDEEEDHHHHAAAKVASPSLAAAAATASSPTPHLPSSAAADHPGSLSCWGGGGWWRPPPSPLPPRQQQQSPYREEGGGDAAAAAGRGGRVGGRGSKLSSSSSNSNKTEWWPRRRKTSRGRPLIEEWRRFCVKEKAIYAALNMFEDSGATLRAECWFPTYQEAKLRFLIAEQSSRSHATAFLLLQQPPWGRSWSSSTGGEEDEGEEGVTSMVAESRSSSSPSSYFFGAAAQHVAPTFFRLPPFLLPFQQLVDTYGVPRHREINPAVFACVFFPFLFGVMYGDIGHGAALLAAAAALFSLNAKTGSKSLLAWKRRHWDSLRSFVSARHMLFLMGFFATYAGFMYNEVLSLGVDFFGSRWRAVPASAAAAASASAASAAAAGLSQIQEDQYQAAALGEGGLQRGEDNEAATAATFHFASRGDKLLPASHGFPYPFGFDPAWKGATNELAVFNSFKMKFAIIVGFTQMLLGLVLHAVNTAAARDWVTFFWGAIPQLLLFVSLIGYIVFLIMFKWMTPAATYKKPSLISVLIDMHMQPSLFAEPPPDLLMFDCQPLVQTVLRMVAYASVPCLLLGKPLWLYFRQRRRKRRELLQSREGQMLLRSLSSSSSPSGSNLLPQRVGGQAGEGRQPRGNIFSRAFSHAAAAAGGSGRGRWLAHQAEADASFFDEEAAVFSSRRHSLESSSTAVAAAADTSSPTFRWLPPPATAEGGGEAAAAASSASSSSLAAAGRDKQYRKGVREAEAAAAADNSNIRMKKRSTRQLLLFEEDGARQDWAGAAEEVCTLQELHEKRQHKQQEQLGEIFIHQIIETIEFVIGTVSNTASYLRLWALSLAHQQLATVFFENTVGAAFKPGLGELQMVIRLLLLFPVFALITLFLILCMDGLECFLHALRLQWVEFQSKFYKADGYAFEPLSFSRILRESKRQSSSSNSSSSSSSASSTTNGRSSSSSPLKV